MAERVNVHGKMDKRLNLEQRWDGDLLWSKFGDPDPSWSFWDQDKSSNFIRRDQYCRNWRMCQVCLLCTLTSPIYEYLRYVHKLTFMQANIILFHWAAGTGYFFLFAATDSENIRWKKWGWFGRRRVFSILCGMPFSFFILWEESGSNLEMNQEDWWSVLARWKYHCARNERSSRIMLDF